MSVTQALNLSSSVYIYATHEDYVELMPTWGYAVSAFVLFLIGFFGFFLNLMVIVLMFKDKQLWTPLNVILFNLVCSDFSVSVLGNPFTLISALSHRWVFGKTMCVLYGFFMTLLGITSITTLTVLSFERYMMVSRPLVSRHLSMRGASLSIFFIWSYSFLVTSPPLFGWGNYINEAANISCSINWEEQTFNTLTYILFLFWFGLVLPVIIITFSYMSIIRTMKKNAVRMGRVTKAESRVTMMVLIMIITFMIAWTPYAILALIEQFAPHDMVSPGLGVVPALVAKSSICYDPIIYVGMNTQFRSSVKQIFGFGEKEDSMHERGMDNTLMSPTKPVSHYNDNNIKLQYLNPNNNTMVAVTIYQDDEYDGRSSDDSQMDKKKKSKLDKNKKKITLTGKTILDESTEQSAESYAKEGNELPHVCSNKHSKNILIPQPAPDAKTVKEITYQMYDENSAENNSSHLDSDTNIIATTNSSNKMARTRTQLHDYAGKVSDNSSSGQIDDFNSDDMLIGSENNESCGGATNKAMSFWDESSTDDSKQIHGSFKPETYFKQHESPASLRRKSVASTQLKYKPDSDMKRIKSGSVRRKSSSSGVLAGHTRKLSAALHDTRGNIVTRLMVDERERSKLMCFEEQKVNFQENKSLQGEQMM